jgi:hypothetical protein
VITERGRQDNDGVASLTLAPAVVLFPEIAQAALKAKEHGKVANWGLLRAHDTQGSGRLPLREAQRLISLGRGVSGRQARRLLAGGDGQYWAQDPGGHVRYYRPARVAERLGVAHVTRPRVLDTARLRSGQTSLKAALESTCYRNDGRGTPLTRRLVEELTGVPPSTQRRWENRYGNAELVAPCYVKRGDVGPMDGAAWLASEGTWGFFWGKGRQLMRRHGDIRRSHHGLGSAAAARRTNRELSRAGGPAQKARGQRTVRVYFAEPGAGGARAWARAKAALGKQAASRVAFDPALNYSVLSRVGRRGGLVYESVTEPGLAPDIV